MTLNERQFGIPRDAPPHNHAVHKLSRLQADLALTARTWALDELGAAAAHQLSDPLTALLLYLRGIEQTKEHAAASGEVAMQVYEMVGKAVLEADRVCDVLARMRDAAGVPVYPQPAVTIGRDAMDAWARGGGQTGDRSQQPSSRPADDHRRLTPREREVLALITSGASNKEGSHRLAISTRTFEVHRAHIMRKLGARNAADLVRMALMAGQ